MVVIAAAVLVIIAQAYARQATKDKASVARRRSAALSEAEDQAEDAAQKTLNELERIRVETAEQVAACRMSAGQADAATRAARAELEQFRTVAAEAVTNVQQPVQVTLQQAITDPDRIVSGEVPDLGQQTEWVKNDAPVEIRTGENQIGVAEAIHEPMVKIDELVDASNAEKPEKLDETVATHQLRLTDTLTIPPKGVSARRTPKMTPALVERAQRMYNSGDYTVAQIAESFDVSPTTIYRHLRTRRNTTH